MSGWLIVGLGNPGPTYAGHRHNVGAMVVHELAHRAGVSLSANPKQRAQLATARLGPRGFGSGTAAGICVVLATSRTYMNESGVMTAAVAKFHRIPAAQVIAVHDELDLELGSLRCKLGGGDNGHNGLKSIRAHLGTGDFFRVRVGIGRPPGRQDPAGWVLSNFAKTQESEAELAIQLAADACETIITEGLASAQNRFNS